MQLVPRASPQRAPGAHFVSGLTHPGVPNPPRDSSERGTSDGLAPSPRGTRRAVSACTSGARSVGQIPIRRRALMAPSNLSKRFQLALALLTAVPTSGAIPAAAATTLDTCGYIFKSTDPRTYVAFSESTVLRAFSPKGSVRAEPGLTIKVWYNDEHALTLGVRQVVVKSRTGTTTTDYPFAALTKNPGSALYPQVGTTALDGDQAGTDSASCSGHPDLCDRPMFPAMFLTDITTTPNSRIGDWQGGGAPLPPHAIFGTWKGAVRYLDKTKNPPLVTVTPDAD